MRSFKRKIKDLIIRGFLSYDRGKFASGLRSGGVQSGDVVMVHSSWMPGNGFLGKPLDMINGLKDVIGPDGLLSMVSMTYQNESSKQFLSRGVPMNVRRSASKMGLLTEVFRRGGNVKRSLSPTHPILAWGDRAEEFLAGHERTVYSFGKDSPFGKLLAAHGKILCIDAPFSTITFTHFLEDRIRDTLVFPLYDDQPVNGLVIDHDGNELTVPTYVLSEQANRLRREERLLAVLDREGIIKRWKIGNTRMLLIDCQEMTACVDAMVKEGASFFDRPTK
jgi:aminoglycoside 3-N-acetyltransferase